MLTHKIKFYPDKEQEQLLHQTCGVARFTYNWALNKWNEMYKAKEKPSYYKVKLAFNKLKKENTEYRWLYDVTKCSPEYAISDLNQAFSNFFNKRAKHPKFKKKKYGIGSFSISNDKFWIKNKICKLPKLGKVKLSEKLRYSGKILKGTISPKAGKWYLSVTIQANKKATKQNNIAGIDLGLKDTLVLSNGEKHNIPDFAKDYKQVKRQQKNLSRKKYQSNNWFKQLLRVQKTWDKLNCKKTDWVNKITTILSNNFEHIALEKLNIKGMMKNKRLSAKFQQIGLYSIVEKLKNKANVWQASQFYPSTQLCSSCNYQNRELTLNDRFWVCPECNTSHDRDVNAGRNLVRQALSELTLVNKKALGLEVCF